MRAEAVIVTDCALAESPLWDDRDQALYWVDIERSHVHCIDHRGAHRRRTVPRAPAALALGENGSMLLGAGTSFYRFHFETAKRIELGRIEGVHARRINDGACDIHGRFWTGTIALEPGAAPGALYVFDGQTAQPKLAPVETSNGIDWSPAGDRMYFVDTATARIDVFDFHEGELSNRRPFAIFESGSMPDGLCVDQDGSVWVAFWGEGCVRCFDREGTHAETVTVPSENTTNCVFGGDDHRTLFITVAAGNASKGGVFRADVGARGVPTRRFRSLP